MIWHDARRRGDRPKGAVTRLGRTGTDGSLEAQGAQHHGDPTALCLLWAHRRAGMRADHGDAGQTRAPWGAQRWQWREPLAAHRGVGPRDASSVPGHAPLPWARVAPRAVRGP